VSEQLEQVTGMHVSRETREKMARYIDLLREENLRQNLISAATLDRLWERHILDSAQLLRAVQSYSGQWVDVGSGAGLPGVIVAILSGNPMTLVEPRRLRTEFLDRVVADLALSNVTVTRAKIETVKTRFDRITARAVAPLSKLLGITSHLQHSRTVWVLPKGRNAKSELAEAEGSWHYDLRVEPSCTDAESSILLLSNLRAKRNP
jgi:16S rRNA (guanine527-N7)-methyltransferase